ncbi:MAG TPA: hypothetical protein VM010_04930 [Chitinophagaceae bacterium]|nr:hypothetical protein [Chitinophagaceae bacterium]
MVTAQDLGNGGRQYQLNVYGQHQYAGYTDTLLLFVKPTATDAEARNTLLQALMLGLTPLIAKTPFASGIHFTMKENGASLLATTTRDKWHYWVFRIGARGELSADRVYNTNLLNANFSINRTTDKLKLSFYVTGSRRLSEYTLEDDSEPSKYTVENSDYGVFYDLVKSIGPHWSYGYQLDYSNNTFNNIRQKIYFNPAIEYDIFNYKEVNNRFFVLRYGVEVNDNRYYDTTIYNKIKETLYGHRFSASLTLNKNWGVFFVGINYRNYFHDFKLNNMGVNVNADVRITGGLSFFVNANGGVVHNQMSLVKGDVTEQEVLTRKRQLASTYNYNTAFGLNFRFGSILNNFVNPRFEGYGGF